MLFKKSKLGVIYWAKRDPHLISYKNIYAKVIYLGKRDPLYKHIYAEWLKSTTYFYIYIDKKTIIDEARLNPLSIFLTI